MKRSEAPVFQAVADLLMDLPTLILQLCYINCQAIISGCRTSGQLNPALSNLNLGTQQAAC